MTADAPTILSCHGIAKRFGAFEVLDDCSMTLSQGEIVSVLGQSGIGKTTLFNILAGLDAPDRGEVMRGARVGYMLQKDLLLPWKRLIDNIALPLVLDGRSRDDARRHAAKHLTTFGLEGLERRYPSQLSGGQRQRAALLRTYLYSRELMLLDEPFSGLDALTREQLYDWLLEHRSKLGLSILLITHDIEEALRLSDRIYVLSQGHPASLWPSLAVPRPASLSEDEALLATARLRQTIRRRLFAVRPETVDV
jgi:ABC-type nitrate/sulfonate/bicarbonate transport system ATPase subunit